MSIIGRNTPSGFSSWSVIIQLKSLVVGGAPKSQSGSRMYSSSDRKLACNGGVTATRCRVSRYQYPRSVKTHIDSSIRMQVLTQHCRGDWGFGGFPVDASHARPTRLCDHLRVTRFVLLPIEQLLRAPSSRKHHLHACLSAFGRPIGFMSARQCMAG